MGEAMMIKVKNIVKSYGALPVLRDFSLEIPKGSRLCIMGRSGCGKTTLLKILGGMLPSDGGEVEGILRPIPVFQEDRLAEAFTPLRNLLLVTKKREEALALLSELRLGDAAGKPTRELSGGMKRRVAIARALLAQGDVLLMDEPFKGLDEETRSTVAETVLRHLGGRTLIAVTHDEEDAALLGASVLCIDEEK
jgi:NitT/TauT family transport system ATP-binding protein